MMKNFRSMLVATANAMILAVVSFQAKAADTVDTAVSAGQF